MSKSLWIPCLSILPLAAVIAPALAQDPGIRLRAPQQQPPAQQQARPPQQALSAAPQPPKPPIQLSPQEQQHVDQLLAAWEKASNEVESFKCKFTRWDYDKTFGPKDNDYLKAERRGEILFRAPDKGTIKDISMKEYEPPKDDKSRGTYVDSKLSLEHWVCDGDAIYQFKPKEKTLEITKLPPHMRGKAITEGPLPFVFGAKAATLRERYWIRDITPREEAAKFIWLEAYPKFAQQAAEFQRVRIILARATLLPSGMEIYMAGGNDRSAYSFENPVVNDLLAFFKGDFMPPMTPFGWKKVYNSDVAAPPAAQAPPANPLQQALKPKTNVLR